MLCNEKKVEFLLVTHSRPYANWHHHLIMHLIHNLVSTMTTHYTQYVATAMPNVQFDATLASSTMNFMPLTDVVAYAGFLAITGLSIYHAYNAFFDGDGDLGGPGAPSTRRQPFRDA